MGHYLLEKELGSGGMGTVFLAQDLGLKRRVAIKVLRQDLLNDDKLISTFEHEAKITASLNHPNIVQVYKFEHDIGGSRFLIMEFISSGSLEDQIERDGHLPEHRGLEIGIAVASGLSHAYQQGLIHRDIKPANILFDENGHPKVVDFGLSLALEDTDQLEGEIWGTPYYVAPEKLDEQSHESWKSDLYSLGASLFHAICGRPPFDGETPQDVAMRHLQGFPVSIRAFRPDVSNETALALHRAMARNPEERFHSYEEFISHLQNAKRELAQDSTRESEISGSKFSQKKWKRSDMLLLAAMGGVILSLIYGLAMLLFF